MVLRRLADLESDITSNRPLENWGPIGDVPSATAILDLFLHHATVIVITGKSHRLRNLKAPQTAGDDLNEPKPANLPTGPAARRKPKSTSEVLAPSRRIEFHGRST